MPSLFGNNDIYNFLRHKSETLSNIDLKPNVPLGQMRVRPF